MAVHRRMGIDANLYDPEIGPYVRAITRNDAHPKHFNARALHDLRLGLAIDSDASRAEWLCQSHDSEIFLYGEQVSLAQIFPPVANLNPKALTDDIIQWVNKARTTYLAPAGEIELLFKTYSKEPTRWHKDNKKVIALNYTRYGTWASSDDAPTDISPAWSLAMADVALITPQQTHKEYPAPVGKDSQTRFWVGIMALN